MDEIAKQLGSGSKWTAAQLSTAQTFSKVHPRIWWAFTRLPSGKLQEMVAKGIANQTLSENLKSYLWRFADRQEDKEGKVKRHSRPTQGDKVEIFAEIDTVTYCKHDRVVIDFDTDPGWRGRVILDEKDIRYEDLVVRPSDRIRVAGFCLSKPDESILLIGDRNVHSSDLRVEVMSSC